MVKKKKQEKMKIQVTQGDIRGYFSAKITPYDRKHLEETKKILRYLKLFFDDERSSDEEIISLIKIDLMFNENLRNIVDSIRVAWNMSPFGDEDWADLETARGTILARLVQKIELKLDRGL
jgi:hypothetical protein